MTDPAQIHPAVVELVAETELPTSHGLFRVRAYRDLTDGTEPLALMVGRFDGDEPVPVRVHDACLTSEVFGSLRCDCRHQLDWSLDHIQEAGRGVVIYLHQEGRGIGLANKIAAYALQEQGLDTVDANRALGLPDDIRRYDAAAAILRDLGVRRVRLLTNNPRKIRVLREEGVDIADREPVLVGDHPLCLSYQRAKKERMGHAFDMGPLAGVVSAK